MSRKPRIPVSSDLRPLSGHPFASIEMAGLPEGPESAAPAPAKPRTHRIVLRREKAHRGGKAVLVVSQLPTHLSIPEIERLAGEAKRGCGCGGTVRGREIELQGDNPARVRAFFEGRGYQVAGI